jgi:aromatic ring-cleaving dioxygenase
MTEITAESVDNRGYHAHIYYDLQKTRAVAERVCAAVDRTFQVEVEGFRDEPRGPHPISNVLIIFKPDQFEHVVPWLMLNREGLDVLVHPLTTDAVEDHSSYAIWLGNPVELKLHTMSRRRGGQLPSGVTP